MSTSLNFAEYRLSLASFPFSAALVKLFPFSEMSPFCKVPLVCTDSKARAEWVLEVADRML